MGPQPVVFEFPLGGVSKRFGFENQTPQTTPSALNVWPIEWSTGRARGGVRPGITSTGGAYSGTPLNWSDASWNGGYGVCLTTSAGTYTTTNGSTWTSRISAPSSSTFASSIVYNNILYQADASGAVKAYNFGTSGATTLSALVANDVANSGGNNVTPPEAVPANCGIIYRHAGRLLFAGFPADPHLLVTSRTGNPFDYDFSLGANDPGAAWQSSGIAGIIRNPITSLFSHGNGCLLINSPDSIDVIRGDLLVGSTSIEPLAHEVGPLMQSAICKTDDEWTVFLARLGLYGIQPGCGAAPQQLTTEIPNELVAVNPGAGDTASVCFDNRYGGVHVYVDKNGGTDSHWFYHLKSKAWWPMSFSVGTMKLACNLKRVASLTKSGLLALRSGSTYQFDTASNESIASEVWYGPFLSPEGVHGKLQYVDVTLSEGSTVGTFGVYGAKSAQEAFARATPNYSWTDEGQQLNYRKWCMVSGSAFYVKVSGTGSNRPCVERIRGSFAVQAQARRTADDA